MRINLLCCGLLVILNVNAQISIEDSNWNYGTITLSDGKTLTGKLRLIEPHGEAAIQIKTSSTVKTLVPAQVSSFEFFNEATGVDIKFVTQEVYLEKFRVVRPVFFHVLHDGQTYKLLKKYIYDFAPFAGSDDPYIYVRYDRITHDSLLFLSVDGDAPIQITFGMILFTINSKIELTEHKISRKGLFSLLGSDYKKAKDFAKEHHLKFRREMDLLKIFTHLDSDI